MKFKLPSIVLASVLAITILPTDIFAQNVASKKEIQPGIYEIQITPEQAALYDKKTGLDKYEKYSTKALGRYVNNLDLKKVENLKNEEGEEVTNYYYNTNLKNNLETKSLQSKINSRIISAYSSSPYAVTSEGDFRIQVTKGNPTSDATFDTATGYKATLMIETYSKAFGIISGFAISNPVYGLLADTAVSLIADGALGKANAKARERRVWKEGQVFHNGSWRTYFTTMTDEVYWSHEQEVWKNGSPVLYKTDYYLSDYWMPIIWANTHNFTNSTEIANITLYQYDFEPERTTPVHDPWKYEYQLDNWKLRGPRAYN